MYGSCSTKTRTRNSTSSGKTFTGETGMGQVRPHAAQTVRAGGALLIFCVLTLPSFGFNDADLEKVRQTNRCGDCDLAGADMAGSVMNDVQMPNARIAGAKMAGADLSSGNLSGADLSGADLSRADLSYTNLWHVNLSKANLSGGRLIGARLQGAP